MKKLVVLLNCKKFVSWRWQELKTFPQLKKLKDSDKRKILTTTNKFLSKDRFLNLFIRLKKQKHQKIQPLPPRLLFKLLRAKEEMLKKNFKENLTEEECKN